MAQIWVGSTDIVYMLRVIGGWHVGCYNEIEAQERRFWRWYAASVYLVLADVPATDHQCSRVSREIAGVVITQAPRNLMVAAIEEEVYPCALCRTGVVTRWTERGMLSDPNITLVADWVFHSSCWDGMVRENPPTGGA